MERPPAHFGRLVWDWLNVNYPGKWMGRGGPVAWPPRSPDLDPLDYYFLNQMCNKIFPTELTSREKLIQRISVAGNDLITEQFSVAKCLSKYNTFILHKAEWWFAKSINISISCLKIVYSFISYYYYCYCSYLLSVSVLYYFKFINIKLPIII